MPDWSATVWERSHSKHTGRIVLLYLAHIANAHGVARTSVVDIARRIAQPRRSVQRGLTQLEHLQEVKRGDADNLWAYQREFQILLR